MGYEANTSHQKSTHGLIVVDGASKTDTNTKVLTRGLYHICTVIIHMHANQWQISTMRPAHLIRAILAYLMFDRASQRFRMLPMRKKRVNFARRNSLVNVFVEVSISLLVNKEKIQKGNTLRKSTANHP